MFGRSHFCDPSAPPAITARRGGTVTGLLVTLSLLGTLTVGAIVVSPRFLQARESSSPVVTAQSPRHQAMLESLAALIGRSRQLIAMHDRSVSPYVEAVLWLEDADRSGTPDPPEIAVLSHSEILRTITIYGVPVGLSPEDLAEVWPNFKSIDLTEPGFCDRWRSSPLIATQVIGTGISDLQFERLAAPPEGRAIVAGSAHVRIALTWSADSVDGAEEASTLVEAVWRLGGAQE